MWIPVLVVGVLNFGMLYLLSVVILWELNQPQLMASPWSPLVFAVTSVLLVPFILWTNRAIGQRFNKQQVSSSTNNRSTVTVRSRQMAKMVKITDRSAIRVEAVEFPDGKQGVNLRQFYTTQKEPDTWKPGYQGMFVPLDKAAKIGRYIRQMAEDPETKFKMLEAKEPKKKPEEQRRKR